MDNTMFYMPLSSYFPVQLFISERQRMNVYPFVFLLCLATPGIA